MSKVEHNGIYYDPNNEIVCDKRTLNNLIVENEHYKKQIADLEAKLAESETLSQRLQSVIDNLINKSFAGSTLVDAINNVYEPIYKFKFDECEELKQQLAEHNEYFRSFSCENFNEFQDFISTFMLTPHEDKGE